MDLIPEWSPPELPFEWPESDVVVLPAGPNRAATPGLLPGAGPVQFGEISVAGRPVVPRPYDGSRPPPTVWISNAVVPDVGRAWSAAAERFADTGLWPLRLHSLYDGSGRPWSQGELEPVARSAVDAIDFQDVLARGWRDCLVPIRNPWPPGTGPLAPFGSDFPGLAPPQPASRTTQAGLMPGAARLGLVSCDRPADAVALAGWTGAINRLGTAQVSAVLRSWEDRFGVVLVGLAFATITLLVTRPPSTDEDALRVAAEIAAFCPDVLSQDGPWDGFGYAAGGTIERLARLLHGRSVWNLWWD